MGLAASQARFLAITSRKMNCEFQSMQIAQQKLSVTRDLQTATRDYQTSLTKTKLVWDTMDDEVYDLSYDMMMSPSAINQYDPYLVTDVQGKLVLNDAMYNAAVAAGIIDGKTGDPIANPCMIGKSTTTGITAGVNDGSRNAFLYQLGVCNQVDASTVNLIESLGEKGYTMSGIGGEVADKSMANALNISAFTNYLSKTYKDVGATPPSSTSETAKIYNIDLKTIMGGSAAVNKDFKDGNYVVTHNGECLSQSAIDNLSLGDILSGKYELSYKGGDWENKIKAVLTQMANLLGMDAQAGEYKGLNVDTESDSGLDIAHEFTTDLLNATNKVDKGNATLASMCTEAQNTNHIVVGSDNRATVSLNNLLKSFLTNFAAAIDGYGEGWDINDTPANSHYVTDELNYYFVIKNEAAMTEQDLLIADFYNMFYNQLCQQGACNDANKRDLVTDKEYLAHALKNGQLFVSSLNNDGYFYQGPYTLNGHVAEVPDESAIAQAELEYNIIKGKLNYKEETLELEMKNLDAEISALTTEFDTVKNLISKGVEKVFTMFSS